MKYSYIFTAMINSHCLNPLIRFIVTNLAGNIIVIQCPQNLIEVKIIVDIDEFVDIEYWKQLVRQTMPENGIVFTDGSRVYSDEIEELFNGIGYIPENEDKKVYDDKELLNLMRKISNG